MAKLTVRRNMTPPEVADRYGVSTAKVLKWIRQGELRALNLAHRECIRPRYSISVEALKEFERARTVCPNPSRTVVTRQPKNGGGAKDYFPE